MLIEYLRGNERSGWSKWGDAAVIVSDANSVTEAGRQWEASIVAVGRIQRGHPHVVSGQVRMRRLRMRRLRIALQREDSMGFVRVIGTVEFVSASASAAAAKASGRKFHVGAGFRFEFRFDPLEGFADVGRFWCVSAGVFQTITLNSLIQFKDSSGIWKPPGSIRLRITWVFRERQSIVTSCCVWAEAEVRQMRNSSRALAVFRSPQVLHFRLAEVTIRWMQPEAPSWWLPTVWPTPGSWRFPCWYLKIYELWIKN